MRNMSRHPFLPAPENPARHSCPVPGASGNAERLQYCFPTPRADQRIVPPSPLERVNTVARYGGAADVDRPASYPRECRPAPRAPRNPRLVRLEIVTLEKADFVGCYHRRPGRRRQVYRRFEIGVLLRSAGALHFEVKTIREQRPPVGQPGAGLVELVVQQSPPHFALATAGQRDQTIGISSQPGMIDQWNAPLLTFKIATGC